MEENEQFILKKKVFGLSVQCARKRDKTGPRHTSKIKNWQLYSSTDTR